MNAPVLVAFLILAAAPQTPSSDTSDEVRRAVRLAFDQRYQEALHIFRDELADDPEDPLLNYYCGITYLKMERTDAAIAYLSAATRKKAPFPEAYRWLAEAYWIKGDLAKARQAAEDGWRRFEGNEELGELRLRLQSAGLPQTPRR